MGGLESPDCVLSEGEKGRGWWWGTTGLSLRQGRVLEKKRGHNTPRSLKISRDSNCCHVFNRLEFKLSQPD